MLDQEFYVKIWTNEKPHFPSLQLLNFESYQNKYNQYILRLSDGFAYSNCLFIPKDKIIKTDTLLTFPDFEIKRWDIIRVQQYQIKKIDNSISKVLIIIKKISFKQNYPQKIGRPQELIQFVQNQGIYKQIHPNLKRETIKIQGRQQPQIIQKPMTNQQIYQICLTINDVKQKKKGKLLARVLRSKIKKIEKDQSEYTILIFRIIDKNNQVIRCEMIGSPALKAINEKKIQVGKVYLFQNIQPNFNEYYQEIYLRFNRYQGIEIDSDFIQQKLAKQKYIFHKQALKNQNYVTDMIGTIYSVGDQRQITTPYAKKKKLIELQIVSDGRLITISFWNQISKIISNQLFTKKQPILLCDVYKKGRFYQFNGQSTFIRLNQHPQILEKNPQLQNMLKSQFKIKTQIRNISECKNIEFRVQQPQIIQIYVYIELISQNSIYYSNCKECNSRIKNQHMYCGDCNSNHFNHKYSAYLTLADYTGNLKCTAFDDSAVKLFNKPANEIHELKNEKKLNEFLRKFILNKEYLARLQFRRELKSGMNKIVVKSIIPVQKSQLIQKIKYNISKINQHS